MSSLFSALPPRLYPALPWPALLLCLAMSASLAAPIDEFRISALEQKVRELESATREQARLLTQLQGQPAGAQSGAPRPNKAISNDALWLNAGNWQRLKPGMSELQVIEVLGPPTQLRLNDAQGRSMMYGMEIGRSGFLVGRVELRDSKVYSIEIPHLK